MLTQITQGIYGDRADRAGDGREGVRYTQANFEQSIHPNVFVGVPEGVPTVQDLLQRTYPQLFIPVNGAALFYLNNNTPRVVLVVDGIETTIKV
jgi:hypothetical protein